MQTHAEILASTYRNAREAAANTKRLRGWEMIRATMVRTAWQVRKEMRQRREIDALKNAMLGERA